MSYTAQETVQAVQKALEPFIRPRDEADHIRRTLALHLKSCHENGPENGPLSLTDSDCTIKSTTDARGLQREYLKALHANVRAQREYEEASRQPTERQPKAKSAVPTSLNDTIRLEEYVTTIKLKRKQEKLQTVERYLDLLGQKPAASPEFLQPGEIFRDAIRLPEVPKIVVSSFTVDKDSTKTGLKALVDRLEKAVLRSKLLLRKEEQLLEEVKSRSRVTPGKVTDSAKLAALSTTRNELIGWIESELGKASASEASQLDEGGASAGREAKADSKHMDEQLALIRDKYASYVAARKTLIQLVGQRPQPSIRPPGETKDISQPDTGALAPSTYLLTPYIDSLLSVAQEQKASITQKSHLNNILAKQTEETGRALNHLAEESQLLPAHPMRGGSRHKQGLDDRLNRRGSHEVTDRVQPWVSAADSAKLATLEAVAEKIEEGQVALEASTKDLAEIDQLLGRNANQGDESVDGDTTLDDIWLAESQPLGKGSKAHVRSKSDAAKERDIWSMLDGSLGLINSEDSPHK